MIETRAERKKKTIKQKENKHAIDYSIINFIYGLIVHIQILFLIIIRIIIFYFVEFSKVVLPIGPLTTN